MVTGIAKSTVLKLQKWHAPKKSQFTRQIDTASRNLTQAPLEALDVFYMYVGSPVLWLLSVSSRTQGLIGLSRMLGTREHEERS